MADDKTKTPHQTNQAFYDRISRAYDLMSDSSEHTMREAGEQALKLQSGESVVEIGFGTGNSVINLAKVVGAGGKVCGIDISPGMLGVAQEKIDQANLPATIELAVGDARELPYPDNSFDAGFTSFTLELFDPADIPRVLAEVRRVLRPGGRMGVVSMATVASGEHESMLEKTYIWMHRHFPHIVDCRPIDPAAALQAAGYEIHEHIRKEMWTMPVAIVIGAKAG